MNIVLIGVPGAGKGTAASFLSEILNIPCFSVGDFLRDEISKKTNLGQLAISLSKKGRLMPDNMISKIVSNKLEELTNGYILDGFPRTLTQAINFEKMTSNTKLSPHTVVHFNVNTNNVISRLAGRIICTMCKSIYHNLNKVPIMKGICDKCSQPLVIRSDDNIEDIKNRINDYNKFTKPVIDYYTKKGITYMIDANLEIDLVRNQLKQYFMT